MTDIDVAALRAAVDKAHDEMVRMCSTREDWRMSIPANPKRDSDLIFDEVLSKVPALLDRLAAAEAAVARAWDEGFEEAVGDYGCDAPWGGTTSEANPYKRLEQP